MNEGRNQYIGIILISILVYILMIRIFKPKTEDIKDANNQNTEQVDSSATDIAFHDDLIIYDSLAVLSSEDSAALAQAKMALEMSTYGMFSPFTRGTEEKLTLENELISMTLSSKGAQVKQVELKEFKTFDHQALLLVNNTQELSYELVLEGGQVVQTKDLYFSTKQTGNSVVFTADLGEGKSFQMEYKLNENSYLVDFNTYFNGLANKLQDSSRIELDWNYVSLKQERDFGGNAGEKTKSSVYWKNSEGDVEHLAIGKSKEELVTEGLSWISCKQKFFNTSLINNMGFEKANLKTTNDPKDSVKIVAYENKIVLAYNTSASSNIYNMQFYFGPNNYKLLKTLDNDLHKIVELSADFFLFKWVKYINAGLIIPLFNLLEKFFSSYGIIILIMTFIIKLILMPLTFKSYVSTAKTKLLKPELDALREKYGDDQAGYAKEQMDLYSKAGVSMFGGCLPMLLQMPFLLAMFYFFPSSIELRQESFLWAQDLSSFDTIPLLTFSKSLPLIGSHISIFTVLMTISSLVMAKFNPQMSAQPTQPGMEMMKYMPYIFPFFLFFLFNNFPAALTYYYFLSNMITFGQQLIINKFFIDEDKLRLQLEENKKKPVKKSGWASKMEEIYKQQQAMQEQQKKDKK